MTIDFLGLFCQMLVVIALGIVIASTINIVTHVLNQHSAQRYFGEPAYKNALDARLEAKAKKQAEKAARAQALYTAYRMSANAGVKEYSAAITNVFKK